MANENIQELKFQVGEAWKGVYSSSTAYGLANVVQDATGLSIYRSLKSGNVGHPVSDRTWWFCIIDMSSIKSESDRIAALNDAIARDEALRVAAEELRQQHEATRVAAETQRNEAEQARISAEQARVNAESARATAEQQRITAEQGRVSAETARVQAEQARVLAETLRANAEDQRAANEQNRVAAEQQRIERAEQDHQRAESDHATYVDSLGAFDISSYHATDGVLAKYADLTAALGTGGANIPDDLRKGGMSVKFVQSSDNKYVQYFLTKNEWSTSEGDWEKMNLEEEVSKLDQDIDIEKTLSVYQSNGTASSNNASWEFNDVFLQSGKTYYIKHIGGDIGNFAVGATSLISPLVRGVWLKVSVPDGVSGYPYSYIGAGQLVHPTIIRIAESEGVMAELNPIKETLEEITDKRYKQDSTFTSAGSGSIWFLPQTPNYPLPTIGLYQNHTAKIAVTPGQRVSFTGKGFDVDGNNRTLCMFAFFDNTTDAEDWSDLTGFVIGVAGSSDNILRSAIVPEEASYVVLSAIETITDGIIDDGIPVAKPVEPEVVTITADRDENSDADFTGLTAIADAINSITDASFSKRYIVHIKGVFHFTDPLTLTMLNSYGNEYSVIDMKPYVDIEGEGPDNTVIFVDFPANATFHPGFHFNDYQPVFFCGTGGNIKNMKIIGKNCRYTFHIEVGDGYAYKGENTINIDNCEVISLGSPDYTPTSMGVFGTGMIPGTIWNIRNCKITNEAFDGAFGIHTPLTLFEKPGVANFINCVFKGKIILANYQVENNTFVNMIGCEFNKSQTPKLEFPYYNSRVDGVKRGDYTTQLFNGERQKLLYVTNSAYENKGAVLRVTSLSTGVDSKVRFGKMASAFNIIIGDSSIDAITKTIYGWDTQYGYVYRDGGVGLSGQAFGSPDVDEDSSSTSSSLGAKLGDCSVTNKNLVINVDGVDYTITFNENYTSKDNAYILGKINDVIGEVATADVFCPGKLYYPNINGLCEVESGDSGSILKGMGVVFNVSGKMVKAKNSDGRIDGICLDDTSLGQTGRVITMGYIYTHFSNQWFKTVDSLDYVPSVRFGLTMGIDPDNDGQFKLLATPALLRCKNECFEIL